MRFDSPLAFLLLALFPLALERETRAALLAPVFGKAQSRETPPPALSFASPVSLKHLLETTGARTRSMALNTCRLMTFALLIVALARPQTSREYAEVESSGRDLMLALDISGSMKALDFVLDGQHVERLTMLKNVVKEFIKTRVGDRIGLIIFGSEVYTQCPLTTDQQVLAQFTDAMEIGMVGEGTALGDAIALSVKRVREIPGQSKAVILVTDGVKTAGALEPKEAAEIAKREGIKVYTIGIGGTKPAPFRVQSPFGGWTIQYADVPLDTAMLQAIADTTGARFFRASQTEELRGIYQEINKLEERIERRKEFVEHHEEFLPFLVAAILSFLLYQGLRGTKYLVVP